MYWFYLWKLIKYNIKIDTKQFTNITSLPKIDNDIISIYGIMLQMPRAQLLAIQTLLMVLLCFR